MNLPKLVLELEDFLTRGKSIEDVAVIQTKRHDPKLPDNVILLHGNDENDVVEVVVRPRVIKDTDSVPARIWIRNEILNAVRANGPEGDGVGEIEADALSRLTEVMRRFRPDPAQDRP